MQKLKRNESPDLPGIPAYGCEPLFDKRNFPGSGLLPTDDLDDIHHAIYDQQVFDHRRQSRHGNRGAAEAAVA